VNGTVVNGAAAAAAAEATRLPHADEGGDQRLQRAAWPRWALAEPQSERSAA
jgi:hypothetical protein